MSGPVILEELVIGLFIIDLLFFKFTNVKSEDLKYCHFPLHIIFLIF